MTKYINLGAHARKKLLKGINTVTNIVAGTLGPCGSNVILRKPYNMPTIVNDGVSIAKEIVLEDPVENAGAELLTAAAASTNSIVGDGTTTTCIVTRALIEEGFKAIDEGCNPILLREALKSEVSFINECLTEHSEDADTLEKLQKVATISVGGNEEMGNLIGEALNKVGVDGVVNLENNSFPETQLSMVDGYKISRGYMSPYAINNTEKFIVDYSDCLVLCCYHRIAAREDVEPLFTWANKTGKPILLVLEDMDENIFGGLQVNLMRKNFNICPVKSPGFGFNVRDYMNDIAKLTGCIVYADDTKRMSEFSVDDFGSAAKVVVSRESTCILTGEKEPTEELKEYVTALKNQLAATENEHMKDSLKERISKLTTGVATISVGATSETEQEELKFRIEDAINATRAAMKGGVVAGAGRTLAAVAYAVSLTNGSTLEEAKAKAIIATALSKPELQIYENSGLEPLIADAFNFHIGINGKTKEVCNLKKAGIIDPTLVLKAVVENSISIASTVLTTHATIISPDKE